MRKSILALTISVLIFLSCGQSQENVSSTALLVDNIHVVDVRKGTIIENQQIVIDSGKIQSITDRVKDPGSYTNFMDGMGQYIVPGLSEMHAHIPSPPTSQLRIEETLFLYLSNGITTIRGMLGHPMHLELKEKVAQKQILSPRIFTSSPSLNGNSVRTPEEAREKVKAYAKAGYDFLKIHPGIKLEVFEELVATAKEEGIPYAGHVPVAVGINRALESGYATIDHIDGFLEGLVPEEADVNPEENGFFGFSFTALADTTRIGSLVRLSKEKQVWLVPTQTLFERWYAPTTADEMLSQPEMKYMPVATRDMWRQRKIQATGPESDFDSVLWVDFTKIRRKLIKSIQEEGHGLLLGSDAPQIFNVPGFSIHHEMETMQSAGLSPLEIIQSGTINVAEYLEMTDTFGEIKPGLEADMLFVKHNPLEDLKALRDIGGVMIKGYWVSKEEIDRRLKEIAINAAN